MIITSDNGMKRGLEFVKIEQVFFLHVLKIKSFIFMLLCYS